MKIVIKELRTEINFNGLANNLEIKLIKRSKKSVFNIAEYISNGKNLKIKPIELPFGIISSSSYDNIETMNIISSDVERNKVLFS